MGSFKNLVLPLIAFLLCVSTARASLETTAIEAILNKYGLQKEDIGIHIEDEKGTVFVLNSDKQFIPASLTKIITAAAALEMMGSSYVFRTQLYADSAIKDGIVHGSIYLKGGGDPSFNSRKLSVLMKKLSQNRVKKITGDIVIDDSRFDDPKVDNWNTVKTMIGSWSMHGYPLFVNLDPPKEYSPLMKLWKRAERNLRTMLVSRRKDVVVYKNMTEPDLWTGMRMIRMFKDSRISFSGKVKRGNVPSDAQLIAEFNSPLPAVVNEMLKSSNNYMAEMLVKNLAAESGAQPVTIEAGIELIRGYMEHLGVKRDAYHLTSAAGYSHVNAISPETVCYVLKYLKDSPVSSSFVSALPVAGKDGTLRYRMRRSVAQGRVHAKTGYLYGAVGLAGYVNRLDGKTLTFAFMYNGRKSSAAAKNAFDKICIEVVQ